jgi:hypothetical protein
MMAAPGVTPRVSTITAPAPTNAFAPPPKVLVETAIDAGSAPPKAAAATPTPLVHAFPHPAPSADCADRCGDTFRDCGYACDADAGATPASSSADAGAKPSPCVSRCNTTYRVCMRGCFK